MTSTRSKSIVMTTRTPAAHSHTILIDRHIEKNGGTSARWFMHRAERQGACTYFGYEMLRDFVSVLHRRSKANWPPLCIEAHTSVNLAHIRALHALCTHHRWRCVFMLRWRRPLAFYLSFFRWGTLPRLALTSPAEAPRAFQQWVRTNPDLQSRILLDSSASTRALNFGRNNSSTEPPLVSRGLVLASLELFGAALGTTEAFSDSVHAAARLLGWPLALADLSNAPADVAGATPSGCRMRDDPRRWWCLNGSMPAADESARVLRAVCPEMDDCQRVVAAAAPLDGEVYMRAQQEQRAQQSQWQHATRLSGDRSSAVAGHSAGGGISHGIDFASPRKCLWRPLCRSGRARRDAATTGCVRRIGMNLSARLALAPSFEPGSGSCYTGDREVLSKAWLAHPSGGRVLALRPFGRLIEAPKLPVTNLTTTH